MRHEIRPGYLLSHAPAPTAPPASLSPMKNGTKAPSVSGVDARARTHPRKMQQHAADTRANRGAAATLPLHPDPQAAAPTF